jgi:peptidoglycan/xylan/chitin deacetylase (PgdA/CDA1 family)
MPKFPALSVAAAKNTYAGKGQLPFTASARRFTGQSILTTFAAGHGFTASDLGGNVTNLNDTATFALGAQCVSVVTGGTKGITTISRTLGSAIDLTNKVVRLWFRVSDVTNISRFTLTFGSGGSQVNSYYWGVLGTGATGPKYAASGEWVAMTIPFGLSLTTYGTPVPTAINYIQIDVADNGAANTFNLGGIAIVDDDRQRFPNGVVSLTFDDSYRSQFTLGRPYMDKYGYGGTNFTICETVDAGTGITVSQLQELEQISGWEIGGHAYSLANHNAGFDTLTAPQMVTEVESMRKWMVSNGFNGNNHFAYPGGRYVAATVNTLREYFASARSTYGDADTPTPADPMRLRSIAIVRGVAAVEAAIDAAYTYGHWLNIYSHDIVSGGTTSGNIVSLADFQTIVDYIAAKGIPVLTVGEVLANQYPENRAVAYVPGLYYGPAVSTLGSVVCSSQRLSAVPVEIRAMAQWKALGISVGSAGGTGSVARLGIYRDNGHGFPGSLLVDAGTVATDATGAKTAAISQMLPPGRYWLAFLDAQVTSAPTVSAVSSSAAPAIGGASVFTAAASGAVGGFFANTVTGSLPVAWPGTASGVWATPPLVTIQAA